MSWIKRIKRKRLGVSTWHPKKLEKNMENCVRESNYRRRENERLYYRKEIIRRC